MLATIGVVLAIVVAALVVVLTVPVHVDLGVDTCLPAPAAGVRVGIRWLRWSWHSDDRRDPDRPRSPRPRRLHQRKTRGGTAALAALRAPGFALALRRLAADLARVLRPREAHGVVVVGLDDPAATGELFGWLQALAWPVRGHGSDLRVVPVFDEVRLDARADFHWRVRPAAVVRPLAAFGFSPAAWRGARAGWRARRSR